MACDRLAGEGVISICCFQFIYLYFVLINGTENGIKMTEKNDELRDESFITSWGGPVIFRAGRKLFW